MPTDHEPEDDAMPAEHDFCRAARNPYAARLSSDAELAFLRPDGSVDQHACPPRPEAAPESLTGIVGDSLFYIYNRGDDVLSVRLTASLTDPVTVRCDGPEYQLLVSEESGMVVGLIVFGYLRRLDFLAPLLALQADDELHRDWIERGLEPLRSLLPAA